MVSVSDITDWIVFLIVLLVTIAVFEIAIQPVLVWIDPMFSDSIITIPGRSSSTPAQLAMLVTLIVISIIEIGILSPLIDSYRTDSS